MTKDTSIVNYLLLAIGCTLLLAPFLKSQEASEEKAAMHSDNTEWTSAAMDSALKL